MRGGGGWLFMFCFLIKTLIRRFSSLTKKTCHRLHFRAGSLFFHEVIPGRLADVLSCGRFISTAALALIIDIGSSAKKTLMHESGHDLRDFWVVLVLDLNCGSKTLKWPTLWCCIVPSGASSCWETSPLTCVSIAVLHKCAMNRLKFPVTQLLFSVASVGYFTCAQFQG